MSLPGDWNYKRLEDVVSKNKYAMVDGPFGSNLKSEHYKPEGIPVLQSGFVTSGIFKADKYVYVEQQLFEEQKRSSAKGGDILMAKIGAQAGRCAIIPHDHVDSIIAGNCLKLSFDDNDTRFFNYVLAFDYEKSGLSEIKTETAQPAISLKSLKAYKVPVPPIEEQKKIAQILSTWDQAIATTERLLDLARQQKKALMQQLLTGKKRFNPDDNYSYLIREGFAKSKLGALPSDWKIELIKKHLWYQEGPGVRNHQFTEEGIKLFNGTNIQFNKIDLANTTTHISEDECIGAYKHFLIDDGDLLIACSGISVDRFDEKIAFASSAHLPLCMNTSTMRFKALNDGAVDITYFQYFMQSPVFKNQIRRQATGSAQLNFGPSHIGKCFVVIPSLEEQQKIASVLSAADQEIETLQSQLDGLKQEKKALMQALLTGKRRVQVPEAEAA
ncbi:MULTISPECIES: restriction endonuclease subunit S [Deefgea]|uniref:Type I restriction modification DNA specificity domain-containing protein n=1 Tax=Deefgea chitinilytica TaxID=570276 RepID=A0ABS2CDG3_9NEIS|nr:MULTISPECIES: restriction endonuclease subunit S [Deefgea]MBM5572097.1 hypothetical protein [Deefgea chitinilytica]MBM9889332.1 restriction endonuclease subunit S [Deefgea sp. CFH1-16]